MEWNKIIWKIYIIHILYAVTSVRRSLLINVINYSKQLHKILSNMNYWYENKAEPMVMLFIFNKITKKMPCFIFTSPLLYLYIDLYVIPLDCYGLWYVYPYVYPLHSNAVMCQISPSMYLWYMILLWIFISLFNAFRVPSSFYLPNIAMGRRRKKGHNINSTTTQCK